jgi:phage terminase large subunit
LEALRISDRYKPLFKAFKGELPGIHTVIVNGGRFSSKSHTTSLAAAVGMAENNHRILSLRQTMTSARDSIVEEFKEKLEILNYMPNYSMNKDIITSRVNKSKVIFKGIQASSGSNTANLKSLKDLSCLLIEEAEELKSEAELDKIRLSIRSIDIEPLTVLVFNAPDVSHFLYEKYFKSRGVKGNFNGIKDGVLYIYTNYRDVPKQFIPKNIYNEYEEARVIYEKVEADPSGTHTQHEQKKHAYYKYTILGGFKNSIDNLVLEHWEKFKEWPEAEPDYVLFGLDFGQVDPNALVETRVYGDTAYIKEHVYKSDMSNQELAESINVAIGDERQGEIYVVADSAAKSNIKELAKLGIYVIPCKKGPGSIEGGLQKMKSMNIFVHQESKNLIYELNHYHYVFKINLLGERKVVPIDKYNHLSDATRYSLTIY